MRNKRDEKNNQSKKNNKSKNSKKSSKLFVLILIILLMTGCSKQNKLKIKANSMAKKEVKNVKEANKLTEQFTEKLPDNSEPKVVLIHGTLFPIISTVMHKFDLPEGFYSAKEHSKRFGHALGHGKIAYMLNKACPQDYSLDNFYYYGWSGKLCFLERKKAAEELYYKIRNCTEPLTIIAHSHGGNIALTLAETAKNHKDYNFKIDRLILLACPVQRATSSYVKSEIFKKVYSFYSKSDMVQILDPQGLYSDENCEKFDFRNINKSELKSIFSQRRFEDSPNLIQLQVVFRNCDISHIDFVHKRPFIKWLPSIISMADQMKQYTDKSDYIVNILSSVTEPKLTTLVK